MSFAEDKGNDPTQIPLQDIENRYKAMTKNSLDAVIVINSQSVIMAWNQRAEILFGWTEEEAVGMDLSELIIPEQFRIAHRIGIKRFMATGIGHIESAIRAACLASQWDGIPYRTAEGIREAHSCC